jgi:hypothetical protein
MSKERGFSQLDPNILESGKNYQYDAECVRKRGNFGPSNPKYLFDSVQRWKYEHGTSQTAGATPSSQQRSSSRPKSQTQFYQNLPTPPVSPHSSDKDEDSDLSSDDESDDSSSPNSQQEEQEIEQDTGFLSPELLEFYSPKLKALLEKIKEQDQKDKQEEGRLFKHFIFTDLKMGPHGAKIIATALQDILHSPLAYSADYQPTKDKWSKLKLLMDDELQATPYQNTVLLSSVSVYQQPIPLKMRKEILQRFNQRPDNIYGKNIRFIVMDSGFKEGIDLFDIKYIHVFEPQTTLADLKQVIGRGTRTCGQQGLRFHPSQGWPLYVQIYDAIFPEELRFRYFDATSVHELYLKSIGFDMRLITLATEMENICKEGAVDELLNRSVHQFSITPSSRSRSQKTQSSRKTSKRSSKSSRTSSSFSPDSLDKPTKQTAGRPASSVSLEEHQEWEKIRLDTPIAPPATEALVELLTGETEPPETHEEMKRYIQDKFSQYKWPPVKMENLCQEAPYIPKTPPKSLPKAPANTPMTPSSSSRKQTAGSQIIQYTPTQAFVSHYFVPENNRKGVLFWHSVGTGKTCSAIATATHSFEKEGYTILWVTRTTLKNDIWKNMFDQVCSDSIQELLRQKKTIPQEQNARLKLLSKAWSIRPMSYKQFTNLVSQKNALYKALVKKNGQEDPLRKTLLIIDEAHKLYGGGDLSSIERPDMAKLQEAIQHSYNHSGKDSVRLLLMTATPMTTSPLEMVQLLNLFKPTQQQIPDELEPFSLTYLEQEGQFTPQGRRQFLDQIAGHISYLNREKDARVFSQPILQTIHVPLITQPQYEKYDFAVSSKLIQNQQKIEKDLATQQKEQIKQSNQEFQGITQKSFEFLDKICAPIENTKEKTLCNRLKRQTAKRITDSLKLRKEQMKQSIDQAMDKVRQLTQKRKDLREAYQLTKQNPETLNRYRNSAFHHVDSTCRQSTTENILQPLPQIKRLQEIEKENQQFIEQTKKEQQVALQDTRKQFQQAKKELQVQVKSTHDPQAKQALRQQVLQLSQTKQQQEKKQAQDNKRHIETLEEELKKQKVKNRKTIRTTLKKYREYVKQTAKNKRAEKKQEEQANKTAKVFEEIAEIQNEELREFANHATEEFQRELRSELDKMNQPKPPAEKKKLRRAPEPK